MSKPADPTDPVESDPNTWQCCSCDSLSMDDVILALSWEGKRVAACPRCGHNMRRACCGPKQP